MKEILLTSSVLILAVLLLRQLFRSRISRRAQYALWALVLVRLLVPVSLPGADFSVLSAAEPVGQAVTERLEQRMVYALPTEVYDYGDSDQPGSPAAGNFGVTDDSIDHVDRTWHSQLSPDGTMGSEYYSGGVIIEGDQSAHYFFMLPISELLTYLWFAGIAGMTVWFLMSNLRFWRKLRKTRTPYTVEGCRYPVYLVEAGLPSPCLFGLIRPAIYLTPSPTNPPTPGTGTLCGPSCGACAWRCTGLIPWCGSPPPFPRPTGSWPATRPPSAPWGMRSAFPTARPSWP